jgi:hypothetical protein
MRVAGSGPGARRDQFAVDRKLILALALGLGIVGVSSSAENFYAKGALPAQPLASLLPSASWVAAGGSADDRAEDKARDSVDKAFDSLGAAS